MPSAFITQQPRPSSRHKRHIDMTQIKPSTIDNKKTRKRRTLERVGASVDHENKSSGTAARTGGADEDLAARIKNFEQKWNEPQPAEKKPKDLLRAIGKIETSDWNIKEIEKKIMENKMGKPNKVFDKEKVPKWSKEQFLARQTKMEKQHLDRQDSSEAKFADIDKSIKNLDQKIKEGTVRQLGTRKIATITEKLVNKVPPEPKPPEKPTTRSPVVLPAANVSEFCHFCQKRVYLMERLSAEGRFFHHSCFKCQYCQTQLRLGSYTFDRDGLYGFKFFCLHHYGMVGEIQQPTTTVIKKPSLKLLIDQRNSPEINPLPGIVGVDLLDRVQTPERVEFSNLSSGHISSDHEEPLSQMDEDEWTDKNFGASCAELADSDDESSSLSDTDSDDEDMFDDALEEPVTKEGTMKWAERWKNSYSKKRHNSESDGYSSSDRSSYYDSSEEDESDTATEGEEEIRARELRKQEVRVDPPVVQTDTGTDTEVKSSFYLKPDFPDIISNHKYINCSRKSLNQSSDNVSVNSGEYNSAESGDLDLNMNKISNNEDSSVVVGKLTIPPTMGNHNSKPSQQQNSQAQPNFLSKSATSGDVINKNKPKRNFVVPPKEKTIGAEFVSKFQPTEPEPLLVIKRTPSKITLPKETKPKVAVSTAVLDKKKYFGVSDETKKKIPLQRSETTAKNFAKPPRSPLVKQTSLPETTEEIKEVKSEMRTFNFEPEDDDIKDIDNYIENLMANEDELHKPIDPNKYKVREPTPPKLEDEKASSSIEDLLKALETETDIKDYEIVETQPEEKIEDLLSWMENLDHQTEDKKVYRSFSDVKYKNLETILKAPQISKKVISKIPKNNLTFFESHLSGKGVPRVESDSDDNETKGHFGLARSKTEITFQKNIKPRTSVDLDAVSKVDIKQMLKKFEAANEESQAREKSQSPIRIVRKRNSFASFRSASTDSESNERVQRPIIPKVPIKNTIAKFENENVGKNTKKSEEVGKFTKKNDRFNRDVRKVEYSIKNVEKSEKKPPTLIKTASSQSAVEDTLKDLENFVMETLASIGNKYEPNGAAEFEKKPESEGWCASISAITTITNYPNFTQNVIETSENAEKNALSIQQINDQDLISVNLKEVEDLNENVSNLKPTLPTEQSKDISQEKLITNKFVPSIIDEITSLTKELYADEKLQNDSSTKESNVIEDPQKQITKKILVSEDNLPLHSLTKETVNNHTGTNTDNIMETINVEETAPLQTLIKEAFTGISDCPDIKTEISPGQRSIQESQDKNQTDKVTPNVKDNTDGISESELVKPHDFAKAVDSTDTSLIEDFSLNDDLQLPASALNKYVKGGGLVSEISKIDDLKEMPVEATNAFVKNGSSISDEYKEKALTPSDFSKVVKDASDVSEKLFTQPAKAENEALENRRADNMQPYEPFKLPHHFIKAVDGSSSDSESDYGDFLKKKIPQVRKEIKYITNKNDKKFSKYVNYEESKSKPPETNEIKTGFIETFSDLDSDIEEQLNHSQQSFDTNKQVANFEDLYAKVNRPKPHSPIAPVRNKKYLNEDKNIAPPRPMRQKSFERSSGQSPAKSPAKNLSSDASINATTPPVPPQRKKLSLSPLPQRKNNTSQIANSDKTTSGGKKEVVTSYNLPKLQRASVRSISPETSSLSYSKNQSRDTDSRDSDKDCCIQ